MENNDYRLFPDGLIHWAGHRSGGVRRPFQANSGRPTGTQLETPLVARLRRWVRDLVDCREAPRVVLLVGGPGNGKTDAVEGCIDALDNAVEASGALRRAFAQQYSVAAGHLPPRKAIVDLSAITTAIPEHLHTSFALVQDATEGDPSQGARAEHLLLDELALLSDPDRKGLYLCCVNRGILAHAASLAHTTDKYANAAELLSQVTRSVTSGPASPSCWPLEGFTHIAVWPMDMESLVTSPSDQGTASVARQIFEHALDEERWIVPCDLKTRCPFCQNRKLLSRKGALDSLLQLLHFYEMSSGKRWTFRDLFSLASYLLIGDPSELQIRGKQYSPCQWAAEQLRIAKSTADNNVDRDCAPFVLASRLYHHRLFPAWPSFDRGDYRPAKTEVFREGYTDKGMRAVQAFFRFTQRASDINALAAGDVPSRVRESFAPTLDPALSTGRQVMLSRDGREYTAADIEERFSLSLRQGIELVGTQIETLERDVLDALALADESLVEDRFPRNRIRQAQLLQSTIRQFAARFVKRSLGTRVSSCKDQSHFVRYVNAAVDPTAQNEVRKELRKLLHDGNGRFRAGLATTFGQPVAERSRDVALVLTKMVAVQPVKAQHTDARPRESTPYLCVEGHYVSVSFALYRALQDVSRGLNESSLPTEIYSLLDRVKALVSGKVVRDKQILDDEPQIVLGSSHDTIDFVAGSFHYNKGAAQ